MKAVIVNAQSLGREGRLKENIKRLRLSQTSKHLDKGESIHSSTRLFIKSTSQQSFKMFNFGTALVLATAVSAIPAPKIEKRDVTTVLNNLETIDAETNVLTADITNWDGSLLGALGISSDTSTLEVRLRL